MNVKWRTIQGNGRSYDGAVERRRTKCQDKESDEGLRSGLSAENSAANSAANSAKERAISERGALCDLLRMIGSERANDRL